MTQGTYAADGVNVNLGDKLSAYAGERSRETWGVIPMIAEVVDFSAGSFRGPRALELSDVHHLVRSSKLSLNSDGVGTKGGLHGAAETYALTAGDLLSMLLDDGTRYGGLPIAVSTVLDISSTEWLDHDNHPVKQLIDGLVAKALEQNVIVLNGELAELGLYVGHEYPNTFPFLWSGTALTIYHPDLMITGEDVVVGDVVIALREKGFRSNGISSVRKAFAMHFGENWTAEPEAIRSLEQAVTPSTCYSRLLSQLNGWHSNTRVPIKHVAHITGGGIVGKFGEDLLKRRRLSAELTDLWNMPEIMKNCAQWRGMPPEEIPTTWNSGNGMLLTLAEEHVGPVLSMARTLQIDAREAGIIMPANDDPLLTIVRDNGSVLRYNLAA